MARRSGIPLSEVIHQLSSDNSLGDLLDNDSDNDLGMNSDYDYSSSEGIYLNFLFKKELLYFYYK